MSDRADLREGRLDTETRLHLLPEYKGRSSWSQQRQKSQAYELGQNAPASTSSKTEDAKTRWAKGAAAIKLKYKGKMGIKIKSDVSPTSKLAWAKGQKEDRKGSNVEIDMSVDEFDATAEVCIIQESPERLLKMAELGRTRELEKAVLKSPPVLETVDQTGKTLLHRAAKFGQLAVMELLLSYPGTDINAVCDVGMTPLHDAVVESQVKAVDFLLTSGARSDILCRTFKCSPLHHAALGNHLDSMKALLAHSSVDIHIRGGQGSTALMMCCQNDSVDCFILLIEKGAKPCDVDESGFYTVHKAVKNVAVECLKALINFGKGIHGCTQSRILNYKDMEGNVPLHIAVNTGEMCSVKLCLEFGADIDALQEDRSTPVHFACTKGEKEMIVTMFDEQPEKVEKVLNARDSNGHTPLHRAAMFNHRDLVLYLLEQGSPMEIMDEQGRTPLLLAAAKAAWSVVALLIEKGANMYVKDHDERSLLHLLVLNGSVKMEHFEGAGSQKLHALFDMRDSFGCTALHYACREGIMVATEKLLSLGAKVAIANHAKESPLHFAARYGRYNTCKKILDAHPSVINMADELGLCALHHAAENNYTRILELLIARGSIFHKAYCGNTPVHLAAKGGHVEALSILLSVSPAHINSQNKLGKTALHVAAKHNRAEAVKYLLTRDAEILHDNESETFMTEAIRLKNRETVQAVIQHDRWQELLTSNRGTCPIWLCVSELPKEAAMAFDRCITTKGARSSPCYKKIFNFRMLQLNLSDPPDCCFDEFVDKKGRITKKLKAYKDLPIGPLPTINLMVKLHRIDLLKHPLVTANLIMKWRQYGCFIHCLNMFLYMVFLCALSYFLVIMPSMFHSDLPINAVVPPTQWSCNLKNMVGFLTADQLEEFLNKCVYPAIIVSIFCGLNVLKEFVQMFHQRSKYFKDTENILEWSLYISSLCFSAPMLIGYSFHFQWEAGAIAILLAWFNFFLFFQRLDMFGIYVVMFLEILKTLVKVLILFLTLFVAFGLSFYVVLQYTPQPAFKDNPMYQSYNESLKIWKTECFAYNNYYNATKVDYSLEAWKTPLLSIMKTLMMTLGEYDYINTFIYNKIDPDDRTLHFTTLSFVLMVAFIVLMPILLMNLLIGLAVGDIEVVRKNADLKRIALQVEWYTELEYKLPIKFLQMRDRNIWESYPNCPCDCLGSFAPLIKLAKMLGFTKKEDKIKLGVSDDLTEEVDIESVESYSSVESTFTPAEARIKLELDEQKQRLKRLENESTRQTQLLRLIIEKMEIKSEADERDEGADLKELDLMSNGRVHSAKAPRMRAVASAAAALARAAASGSSPKPGSGGKKMSVVKV